MTAITSLDEVADRYDVIADRFALVSAGVADALTSDSQTQAQVQALRADVEGALEELRLLRVDLDGFEATDKLTVTEGSVIIAVWRWQRRVRGALVDVASALHEVARIAADLKGQRQDRIAIVRDGETWQSIAARELGDWNEWPRLLAANPDLAPGALTAGTVLAIPDRR